MLWPPFLVVQLQNFSISLAYFRDSSRTLYGLTGFDSLIRITPLLRSFCCFFSPDEPFLGLFLLSFFLWPKLGIRSLSKMGLMAILFHIGRKSCEYT